MSWLSKFVFDPIKASIARASQSSNPLAVQAGKGAQVAYDRVAADVTSTLAAPLTVNSAAALGNSIIKDFEDGLRVAVDGIVTAGLGHIPLGGLIAPEAVSGANMALAFMEQHAATYVAALFGHARSQIPGPAPAPIAPPAPPVTAG